MRAPGPSQLPRLVHANDWCSLSVAEASAREIRSEPSVQPQARRTSSDNSGNHGDDVRAAFGCRAPTLIATHSAGRIKRTAQSQSKRI